MSTPVDNVNWDFLGHASQKHGDAAFVGTLRVWPQHAADHNIAHVIWVHAGLGKYCFEEGG